MHAGRLACQVARSARHGARRTGRCVARPPPRRSRRARSRRRCHSILPNLDLGQIEEIVDQPGQPLGFADDDLQEVARAPPDRGRGVSSRISENERIEVRGVRSSWLTVARKSSLSWSSWRSRSLASRSSAVACSSAATSAPGAAVFDRTRGLVQDLHQIVRADHLAAARPSPPSPGRRRSRWRAPAGARRAGPGSRRPRRRGPARGRAGAGRRRRPCRPGAGQGSGSAARAAPRPWPRRATGRPAAAVRRRRRTARPGSARAASGARAARTARRGRC